MTVIALDAMGGDFAPRAPVLAAVMAQRDPGCEVRLVGKREVLEAELRRHGREGDRIPVVHASQRLGMDEPPSAVLREKTDASVRVAFDLARRREAQGVISAGHSGAVMVAGKHVLGTLTGIDRPAIATLLPLKRGTSLLLDSGANVDCKPHYLLQFARMGRLYARTVLGVEQPRVALLSNGSEAGKGNELVRQTYPQMEQNIANFIGNLEARDLFRGKADVIVCDGFIGNLVLKTAEAAGSQLRLLLKDTLSRTLLTRLAAWFLRGLFQEVAQRTDYREVGGSLLLGLNGVAIVSHGASDARSLYNAIQVARQCAERGLIPALSTEFAGDPSPGRARSGSAMEGETTADKART